MIFSNRFSAHVYKALVISCVICMYACHNSQNESAEKKDSPQPWLLPFVKQDSVNPVMQPGSATFLCPVKNSTVLWDAKNVYNPAVAVMHDTLYMLYRAQDSMGCSRIGLAKSTDGTHFVRLPSPVLYPDNDAYKNYEWPGGCEDPRMVEDSAGVFYLTYTAYDGETARLMLATSTDLYHWKKMGPVFKEDQYKTMWSKSGSIISRYENGHIIATKINGSYWMYWGDKYIWPATSTDLIHWKPVKDEAGNNGNYDSLYSGYNISDLKIAVPTRRGKFDCDIVESGPPALLTDNGVLLIYNSRNDTNLGDSSLPEGTYTVSQVLLDKKNPVRIIDRMDKYFMKPQQSYEFSGEVNNVCFAEALAFYKNKWWLYYGTADSRIAVAVKN